MNKKDREGRKKAPLQLMPPGANRLCCHAISHGSVKYGAWNWRDMPIEAMVYVAAIRRHLDAFVSGEDADAESGLSHIAHVMANCAIVLDAMEHGTLIDDRPNETPPTLYISGPMTGRPEYNVWAFRGAEERAIGLGWRAISPVNMDERAGIDLETLTGDNALAFLDGCQQRDVRAIMRLNPGIDAILTLDGWEESKGARAEVALARWRGLRLFTPESLTTPGAAPAEES